MTKAGYIVVLSVLMLFFLGLVMVFNTSSAEMLDKHMVESTRSFLWKQSIYALLGALAGGVIYSLGYQKVFALMPYAYAAVLFFLLAVFVPGIGRQYNGARRWIGLFGCTFQPSEIAKYILPMYFAYRIYALDKITFSQILKVFFTLGVPLLCILLEPDNGSTFIIGFTLVVCCFLLHIPLLYWAFPLCVSCVLLLSIGWNMPHVRLRIQAYLHPETDLQGKGHKPYQAKIAAGSGGLWGKGLGESLQKFNYLPEAKSDYIAAIVAEELGFIGILGMIGSYLFMSMAGFFIAFSSEEKTGFFLASLLTFLLSFQAFLNLGIVSNLLPSKGTTLPFVSQGGTAMIVNISAVCLLLSVAKIRRSSCLSL